MKITAIATALSIAMAAPLVQADTTIRKTLPGGFPDFSSPSYKISKGLYPDTKTVTKVLPGGFPELIGNSYSVKQSGNKTIITPMYPGGFPNFAAPSYVIERR